MRHQLQVFLSAVMFYTRIPCPRWVDHSDAMLDKATRYLPLIGWIVGGASALVFWGALLLFTAPVAVLLAMATGLLLTGAFHEDGFVDVCDGFGGGWTKERILEIMKDSRIGAYGLIGGVLMLALKAVTLISLAEIAPWFCMAALLLGHVLSRFAAVTMIHSHSYARADASSKVKPVAKQLRNSDLLISALWLLPAFAVLGDLRYLLVLLPVFGMKVYLAHYFQKHIGGYTGDCLGATQQLTEVVTLLSCLALWKFI